MRDVSPRGHGSRRPKPGPDPRIQRRRKLVAAQAAREIDESGNDDRDRARRKAAARLGIADRASLPDDDEIVSALGEHQRLFRGRSQDAALRERREAAIEAMEFFRGFHPRVVGPVLEGLADRHSIVTLHLHGDDADAVSRMLAEHRIPATAATRGVRLAGSSAMNVPCWEFVAGGIGFEVLVLPLDALRQPPLASAGAVARASLRQLRCLLTNPVTTPER